MRTDNEILGEYIRKTRPEITQSFGFLAFLMSARVSDGIRWFADAIKKPEVKKMLEAMRDKEGGNV